MPDRTFRVLFVKKPAFMQAGCGAMPKGMKSACCDLYPMDIACGGWVTGACLGLKTRDLAECCRYVVRALLYHCVKEDDFNCLAPTCNI